LFFFFLRRKEPGSKEVEEEERKKLHIKLNSGFEDCIFFLCRFEGSSHNSKSREKKPHFVHTKKPTGKKKKKV